MDQADRPSRGSDNGQFNGSEQGTSTIHMKQGGSDAAPANNGLAKLPTLGAGELVAYRLEHDPFDQCDSPNSSSLREHAQALQAPRNNATLTPTNSAASTFGSSSGTRSDFGSALGSVSASKRDVIWEDATAGPPEPAAGEIADKLSMPIEQLSLREDLARWPPTGSALGVQSTSAAGSCSPEKKGGVRKVADKARGVVDSLHDKALEIGDKLYQKRRS